jgi:hypothetical protein
VVGGGVLEEGEVFGWHVVDATRGAILGGRATCR